MKVLVVNCGSSSLKYQLIDMNNENCIASGVFERIGGASTHTYKPAPDKKIKTDVDAKDHACAIKIMIDTLTDPKIGVIGSLDEIEAVGHRVVHGGEFFKESVIIDDDVKKKIRECIPLAPIHNPANLIGIEACEKYFPGLPMVAVFDTAFHQTMPPKAYMYAIPYELYEKYKIRRYGFHGTSHSFVSKRAAQFLGMDINNSKIIVCHLGSGASITAIENGISIDTSMGLTPLEGLAMGTRCGNIDPTIIEFLEKNADMSIDEIMDMLNKKSGLLGISDGAASDLRDLEAQEDNNNKLAHMALDIFVYRVAKYIGGYAAAMNGVDAIVFTAGGGENNFPVRARIMEYLGYLGIKMDEKANNTRGEEIVISTPDSKVKAVVIPTNEELAIARDTKRLVEK